MNKMKNIDLIFESRIVKVMEKWFFGISDDYDTTTIFFNVFIRLGIATGITIGILIYFFMLLMS